MELTLAVVLLIAIVVVLLMRRKTSAPMQKNTVTTLPLVNLNKIVTAEQVEFEKFIEDIVATYLVSGEFIVSIGQCLDIIQMRLQWLKGQIDLSTKMIPIKMDLLVKNLKAIEEFLEKLYQDKSTRKKLKGSKRELRDLTILIQDCYNNDPIAFFRQDLRTLDELENSDVPEVTGLQRLDEILFSRLTKKPLIEEANKVISRSARDMHDLSRHIYLKAKSEADLERMNEYLEENEGKLKVFLNN